MGWRTAGEKVRDGLDRVAAVEVGGVGRHLAGERVERQPGGKLDPLSPRRRGGVPVQADLLGFGAPALAQVLGRKPLLLRVAVVSVATWRARAEASAPAASSISARRVEKVLSHSSEKPLISAMPL